MAKKDSRGEAYLLWIDIMKVAKLEIIGNVVSVVISRADWRKLAGQYKLPASQFDIPGRRVNEL